MIDKGKNQFQSTLLRKERRTTRMCIRKPMNFNPRSCVKSDFLMMVSTILHCHFNPRSCVKSDVIFLVRILCLFLFQSTLLRKERRQLPEPSSRNKRFQSTLLRKERRPSYNRTHKHGKFQSTLLRKERL